MINIEFSEATRQALYYERYHHPHPRVQLKMEVLWLKSHGVPHNEISQLAGVGSTTVTSYLQEYKDGGIDALKKINFYRPQSDLSEYQETLEKYFQENPPASIKQAMDTIEKLTGVKRSPERVRIFLHKLGLKFRKVGVIPAKVEVETQDNFKNNELEPKLKEAAEGKRVVFFVDAAHFVLAPFIGLLWCFSRIFIRAPSGRQRFNVLAALNAVTHQLVMVTNDTYITATTVCDLLRKISELQISVPITLVLDNARYQKCKLVIALATSLNIELLFLPAYSPNLNLIERLWKFVKKKCLYSTYYENFQKFKQAISSCLAQTDTVYKEELDSLLSLKFQTFKESQILAR